MNENYYRIHIAPEIKAVPAPTIYELVIVTHSRFRSKPIFNAGLNGGCGRPADECLLTSQADGVK
jgi:hypothetical protein